MSISNDAFDEIKYIVENDSEYQRVVDILSNSNSNAQGVKDYFHESVGRKLIVQFSYDDSYSYVTWSSMFALFVSGARGDVDIQAGADFDVVTYYDLYVGRVDSLVDRYGQGFFSYDSDRIVYPSLSGVFDQSNDAEILLDLFASYNWLLDEKCIDFFSQQCLKRLQNAKALHDEGNLNKDNLSQIENVVASEDRQEAIDEGSDFVETLNDLGPLRTFLNKAILGTEEDGVRSDLALNKFVSDSFSPARSAPSNLGNFYRVFSRIDNNVSSLDVSMAKSLYSNLVETGLFQLASYAYEIGEFAKKRFVSVYDAQQNSSEYIDPSVDLPWLMKLIDVHKNWNNNPIIFASINYYFPSLVDFYAMALSTIVDYSNDGLGGGLVAETAQEFKETLEAAFGVKQTDESNKNVFELAFEFDTTASRIKKVLERSPYRKNIAPNNPDIFHLRLGAANFYVPPVNINVNTRFKTGSLTGGAIRQTNSPKFNSGYRETVVSMRLFFPNYQEIWGVSIDGISQINLNENFEIDFRYREDENGNRIIGDSEEKIDKFLSSLRGLVAAFKFSPILPIKNHYLNSIHGITGVALSNMTISTVPGFPFALAVDIELLNFNHKPFLPMLRDFNQSVHWGKYRQYIGKAANILHKYVNEEFLLKTSDSKEQDTVNETDSYISLPPGDAAYVGLNDREYVSLPPSDAAYSTDYENETVTDSYRDYILETNIIDEWRNGNNITFYTPAEVQTKLFLPDTASFRTTQEETFSDLGETTWRELLKFFDIDINESSKYGIKLNQVVDLSRSNEYSKDIYSLVTDSINVLTAGINTNSDSEAVYRFLVEDFISENSARLPNSQADREEIEEWLRSYDNDFSQYPGEIGPYFFGGKVLSVGVAPDSVNMNLNGVKKFFSDFSKNPTSLLDKLVDDAASDFYNRNGIHPDITSIEEEFKKSFNVYLYENFFKSGSIQSLMEAARARVGNYTFNEWEVPMVKVDMDPDAVIVNGVTVSLSNNFAKLQVQMQDEPSYQHIGGKDSFINISMTVIGEKELVKFKRIFDHITALARLEHATGVIGFLGIKNVITALSGMKYVMPMNYQVSTKPGFPHVYDVNLTLVDFDIFQQKREELSSKQQKDMVEQFTTKKNPFLRIKQMWGAFNAYPDLPLQLKDSSGETVGHLDPDFYFRSFEMFDDDVTNNITNEIPRVTDFFFDDEEVQVGWDGTSWNYEMDGQNLPITAIADRIKNLMSADLPSLSAEEKRQLIIKLLVDYVKEEGITQAKFIRAFELVLGSTIPGYNNVEKWQLLTSFINFAEEEDDENNPFMNEVSGVGSFIVGDLSTGTDYHMKESLEAALEGAYSLPDEEYVSFHPDNVDFHKVILVIPANDQTQLDENKISAMMLTAAGTHFGYIDNNNGRFYLTVAGSNVQISSEDRRYSLRPNLTQDVQTPDTGNTTVNSGIATLKGVSEYQNAYDGDEYRHWEKMMVDTSYRDISGRMLRAFPTYMLWLIDEGGYFAGVKLFDNFYGLQSIIDFSVVSSEDIMGDTLILRLSNMYSKITRPESSKIFNPNLDEFNQDELSLTEGLANIVERTLNMSRNMLGHMRHEYVVDINNIRLKPGVRVHLRAGYGSNPNSLNTLFNGIITSVEQGEIVTVTAQSDAIELGAMVNSTNKKGDSGKIDGGINTGMWLSEPRDLMVRLLSMGSSRTREALLRATKGIIFSENRFGIRHFGSILYDFMGDDQVKHDQISSAISGAFNYIGRGKDENNFSSNERSSIIPLIETLMANMQSDVDLELFKRNIYPGNGTGIAQFLGGDIDDGWSTVASLTPEDSNARSVRDLASLTDRSWNRLVMESGQGIPGSNFAVDTLVADNQLNKSPSGDIVTGLLGGGILNTVLGVGTSAFTASATTVVGTLVTRNPVYLGKGVSVGSSLLGILVGRGGKNLFKTMGVISMNDDDDLPGFDEVSFRAQTYMRTVWDLFQTCARLLPNYIVAVRPFEDRSTVFYGKPHWLYTSGVVPVTTGYRVDKAPAARKEDNFLAELLDGLNRSTNPLADYAAFFGASDVNEIFASTAYNINNSTGIYAPTNSLRNKVINFSDPKSLVYYGDSSGNEIVSKIPVSRGNAYIGFHLPIEGKVNIVSEEHRHISNLPDRYRYPFFANTKSVRILKSPAFDMEEDETSYSDNFGKLMEIERDYLKETSQTLIGENDVLELENPLRISMGTNNLLNYLSNTNDIVEMPKPEIDGASEIDTLIASEWGKPASEEDEQFYVAMKWPYNPSSNGGVDLERFKDRYGFDNLYGTASDYKNRKILVYNPINKRAVVCKPAYFLWGELEDSDLNNLSDIDALVSPDAAYYLNIITGWFHGNNFEVGARDAAETVLDAIPFVDVETGVDQFGFRRYPIKRECFFAFVPDSVPVGVVSPQVASAQEFSLRVSDSDEGSEDFLIGFGSFVNSDSDNLYAEKNESGNPVQILNGSFDHNNILDRYLAVETSSLSYLDSYAYSGNGFIDDSSYFEAVIQKRFDVLEFNYLRDIYLTEMESIEGSNSYTEQASKRIVGTFTPVYTEADQLSMEARAFYDENFSPDVSVIAGDGRHLADAQDIWDEFRYSYHTLDSVKQIFADLYGMDPDSEATMPDYILDILRGSQPIDAIRNFSTTGALDKFSLILGDEFIYSGDSSYEYNPTTSSVEYQTSVEEALEFVRTSFIDAPLDQGGLIESLNNFLVKRLQKFKENFFDDPSINNVLQVSIEGSDTEQPSISLASQIDTPKQLFLLMVGMFRQALWNNAYGRAWLVLQPDRKLFGGNSFTDEQWSFRSVDKVFRAFIDPYADYAKGALSSDSGQSKFLKLLVATKAEGNSSNNIISYSVSSVKDFFSENVGPIFTALTTGLSGLYSMFKLSMQQLGYGVSEAADFRKHAHVMNKVLNDSIYYSLGREGSLLRAVDNPFTREYGEPVLEVREPFQRLHYISSFSHILANNIEENLNGVSTVVTAVSDGKYPVTVALDKGAPAERQTEKTVETGLYYDNMVGSGFFGFLHPLMHPLETFRGVAKNIQGSPDELSARRVALAHLKESIKDIYGGELLVIGNPDIRPHDMVYLSDVYERMYGLFEVEQVVHHFTSDLGFVTAITPNALVTVNDPSRWYLSSWISSWMNTQAIRNDARIYLDSIRDGDSSMMIGGSISIDRLSDMLSTQIVGGLQFTHGSSAIVKDAIALETAKSMPDAAEAVIRQTQANTNAAGGAALASIGFGVLAGTVATVATGGAAGLVAGPIVGSLGSQLGWKGWKWVRDNLLDQHGCYVQYLNRNGQPMDSGLSYSQGMVVGQYHSKALLPGILGVRTKIRTPEGYSYVRSDDLFKSLGWRETEIKEAVRYISYENALVHSRVLNLSSLGPDKAQLEPQFKVLVKVVDVVDGDTIKVVDILRGGDPFTIRFDGINTEETNVMEGKVYSEENSESYTLSILDVSTPGGKAKFFVKDKILNKVIVLRVNRSRESLAGTNEDFDAGADYNKPSSYVQDQFDRTIATIFYHFTDDVISQSVSFVSSIFNSLLESGNVNNFVEVKEKYKQKLDDLSVFFMGYDKLYAEVISSLVAENKYNFFENYVPELSELGQQLVENNYVVFDTLVYIKCLESVYETASQWPITLWDEYYEDGTPVTLNWELVVNNLAKVYVKDLQKESMSVVGSYEQAALPRRVD